MLKGDKQRLQESLEQKDWVGGHKLIRVAEKPKGIFIQLEYSEDYKLTPHTLHRLKFQGPRGDFIVIAHCERAFEWEYPGEYKAILRIKPSEPNKRSKLADVLESDDWSQIPIYLQEQPNWMIVRRELEYIDSLLRDLKKRKWIFLKIGGELTEYPHLDMPIPKFPEYLSKEQREAAERMVTRPFTQLIGFPGTGKTTTLIAIISTLVKENGSNKILVMAHTNEALWQRKE